MTGDWNDTIDSLALSHVLKMEGIVSAARVIQHEFTYHRYRHETGMVTRTIDYVFYFPKMPRQEASDTIINVTGFLKMVARDKLPKTGFPSQNHPSDHLALGYQFTMSK